MDWKIFFGTFSLIFLAELGDKTQLAVFGLVKNPADRWVVFGGAATALAASTLIAVLVGGWVSSVVPPFWFKLAAGLLFLGFGFFTLREAFFPDRAEAAAAAPPDAAACAPGPAALGWTARVALDAAAAFEEATAKRYHRLAEAGARPAVRELLDALARDEREHLAAARDLARAHGDTTMPGECPDASATAILEGVEERLAALTRRAADAGAAPLDAADRAAVEELAAHEDATAVFYGALADRARTEALRAAFGRLAAAERVHAERIRAMLAPGDAASASA